MWGDPGPRWRRPPTPLHNPVAKVPTDLWRLEIEIAPSEVEKLRNYYWAGRNTRREDRTEVLATIKEGTNLYTRVSIHLKGAAGSFRQFDDKPSLTVNFSSQIPEQRFHGLQKLSLNNSVQDPSYLCEAISRELFEAAGVPVTHASHATVVINGRDLGLYVLTEGFGKHFLKRYFKNVGGNLYDSGFVQDITGNLTANSGEKRENHSDLRRLIEAATEREPSRRWEHLSTVLDMDRFASFLAMEIITCHWDGYAMNRNNYRLFHDLETDRMVFIPHGMDQMFGVFRSSPRSSIRPQMQGLVARAFTSTPEGDQMLLERIATLRTNVFIPEKITNRVYEISSKLRPTLAAYGPEVAEEHDSHVANLCRRIVERAHSITQQLTPPAEPIQFNRQGSAQLSGWEETIATRARGVIHFERTVHDGRKVLLISALEGGGSGTWRTRVRLPAGNYRFEGRARTTGVGGSGGVCLRISGSREVSVMSTEDDWSPLRYALTVTQPIGDIELICELRATEGEAAFDEESLRLVRE